MGNRYLDEFFSLRCAGDVLSACAPVNNGSKEITEAMGARHALLDMIITEQKCKYHVLDLCAGNGLFGLLVAHTLPVSSVCAIDKRYREFHLDNVKRYRYIFADIYDCELHMNEPTIVCGVHVCRDLAAHIVRIYLNNENAKKLVLMPCCVGSFTPPTNHHLILERVPKPLQWVWYLADMARGCIKQDMHILSPRNYIITAEKRDG